MMERTIELRAGWLRDNPLIGHLYIEQNKGTESQSLAFCEDWVITHPRLLLSPELSSVSGRQYPVNGRNTFGFLSDATPNRWGRKLLESNHVALAKEQRRAPRRLTESDYLLGVADEGHSGGLRFMEHGRFLSTNGAPIPPITQLRELEASVKEYEKNRSVSALRRLLQPGSSLGGARPKANVVDQYDHMWIAKFPSRNDEFSIGKWESVLHQLAGKCGLNTPSTQMIECGESGGIFLSKRFDRYFKDGENHRLHFASAMTMLNTTDGAHDKNSYLYIADKIETTCGEPDKDLKELWKRMVFNICVSNTDDHLRNHGFLLKADDAWALSPAYDLNPNPDGVTMALNITTDDPTKDVRLALSVADFFRIGEQEAKEICGEMQKTIRDNWALLAKQSRIPQEEIKVMGEAFREAEREVAPGRTGEKETPERQPEGKEH